MRKIALFFCILLLYENVTAQIGTLDSSFGTNGYILNSPTTILPTSAFAKQCFVESDGKLLIVFYGIKTTITRRLPDGSIDLTYGKNGYSQVCSIIVNAAAQEPDGKIIVGGTTDGIHEFILARYNIDGTLDQTFGTNGITTKNFGASFEYLSAVTVTSDERIIAGGFFQQNGINQDILVCFTQTGELDATFGDNGVATAQGGVTGFAQLAHGKFLTVGTGFTVAKYNSDGSPDLSFNGVGSSTDYVEGTGRSIAVASNGKICVGGFLADNLGYYHFRIARFNADGTLDLTFNGGAGSVVADFGSSIDFLQNIRLQSDGKIIGAGHTSPDYSSFFVQLVRVNVDGTIDNSFGSDGNGRVIAHIDPGSEDDEYLTIQDDDKIITGGSSFDFSSTHGSTFTCYRFTPGGLPDADFGTGGEIHEFAQVSDYDYYSALLRQGDGKLIAASDSYGTTNRLLLHRYNQNGSVDNTFGVNGTSELAFNNGSSFFQPDGKLLRVSNSDINYGDIMLVRYNLDGTLDPNFGNNGIVITDFGAIESAITACFPTDGKILIGGLTRGDDGSDLLIARYNSDGTLDVNFGNGGAVKIDFENEDQVQSIAVAADGKIIVGGSGIYFPPDFSYVNGDILMARLNTDGSLDNTFGNQGKLVIDRSTNDFMGVVKFQNDGKILYTYLANMDRPNWQTPFIGRLNSDGSVDNSFAQNGYRACDGGLLELQQDQKILIAGNKLNNQNNSDATVARLNTDGSDDITFGSNGETKISITHLDNYFYTSLLSGDDLFVGGNGYDEYGFIETFIAKFKLARTFAIACPGSQVFNTGNDSCATKVNSIDPIVIPVGTGVKYTLAGATTGSGNGSASGIVFNKGVTTVTYTLTDDASKSCSFTITVQDNQLPTIDNLTAAPNTLWPADHKMKDVTVGYTAKDNCGIASSQISVSSNEPVQSGEKEDKSPDWQIIDNHHVQLRAERLESGNGRTYTISVTTVDVSGNQTSATTTVKVPKSMSSTLGTFTLSVAPNPSSNYFLVTINSNSSERVYARLLDNNGSLLNEIANGHASQTVKIGSGLNAGIYFLQVMQSGVTRTIKLIKQ